MAKVTEAEKAAKRKRDEITRNWHEQAVASGQRRILSRTSKTTNYELYSYLPDEMGYSRRHSGAVVTSTWGMFTLSGIMALGGLLALALFIAPLFSGQGPEWAALFLLLICGVTAPFGYSCAMQDVEAKKVRRARGIPDPSPNQTDW